MIIFVQCLKKDICGCLRNWFELIDKMLPNFFILYKGYDK